MRFTIELTTPACPVKDQMREQARAAVLQVPGVIGGRDRDDGLRPLRRDSRRHARGGRGREERDCGWRGEGRRRQDDVAVNLAVALAQRGSRVGLLDGDMYGPNVPLMLGLQAQLTTDGKKILPAEKYGIQVVSMGF